MAPQFDGSAEESDKPMLSLQLSPIERAAKSFWRFDPAMDA
jgi:hypothetical protein